MTSCANEELSDKIPSMALIENEKVNHLRFILTLKCLQILMFVLAANVYVAKMIESQNHRNARILTFSMNKYLSKIIKLYMDTKM